MIQTILKCLKIGEVVKIYSACMPSDIEFATVYNKLD